MALGNKNLDAESIKTLELAFDYRPYNNLHIGLNMYRFRWANAIEFVSPKDVGDIESTQIARTAQNSKDDIHGHGFEMEMRFKINAQSSLLFNYATHKVQQHHTERGNYPRQDAYLRYDWSFLPNWYLNAQANWVADRKRPHTDPRANLTDNSTLDLTLRYKNPRKSAWNLAFGVKNLFDSAVFEPSPGPDHQGVQRIPYDLPMAGRSYFAELRYYF